MSKFIALTHIDGDCEGVFNLDYIEGITCNLDDEGDEIEGTIVALRGGEIVVVAEEYNYLKSKLLGDMQ